jgi:NADH-quinone oxidoreductase subunit D
MMGIEPPERAKYIRVIMAELQRFASHCMAVGTFVNDCGAWQTPLMYMLREREKVLDLFEMVCGARVTLNYMRIGGVAFDLPDEFVPACRHLIEEDFPRRMEEYSRLLLGNEIILARSRGIGVLPADLAIASSCSGWNLRYPWVTRATATTASSSASRRCSRAWLSLSRVLISCPAGRKR